MFLIKIIKHQTILPFSYLLRCTRNELLLIKNVSACLFPPDNHAYEQKTI